MKDRRMNMFTTEVFVKNDCKMECAKILTQKGTDAVAEIRGKKYDATYDSDSKLFQVKTISNVEAPKM